jgi:5S rRNA maturation endonuclease (ribonuclease M5)
MLAAKRVGSSWMARCPAHNDHNPSLSLREVDGKILVHCHAGCTQNAVLRGLKSVGAWNTEKISSRKSIVMFTHRIERIYDYTDERGRVLYQTVRLHSPKDFRFRYPHPRTPGHWIWQKYPTQVLYRLGEVLEAPIVFVVEGEKDAETMRSYGFVATTNAGGAKAPWLDSYTEALRGREVIIIGDADLPGRDRAKRIARALLGHVARIVLWEPERAKDITEWFENGHSEVELIEVITSKGVRR